MIKDINEYKKKKKILIKHNKYYYNHNASKIDDASYDKLKIELLNFEKSLSSVTSKTFNEKLKCLILISMKFDI